MRLFAAVDPGEEFRHNLAPALDTLRRSVRGVRWVPQESVHLTLKFIGKVDRGRLPTIVKVIRTAARAAQPFAMECRGISGFPPRGKPRVIHVTVTEPTGALEALVRDLDVRLTKKLGIDREERPFKPHMTIGRASKHEECPQAEDIIAFVPHADFGEVRVSEIVLMESHLTPRGPIYKALERIPLGSG